MQESPNETDAAHGRRVRLTWRHQILIGHWVLMFVGTHWPEINRYKPDTGWPIPFFSEAVHGALYGIWAALWWWVLSRRPSGAPTGSLLWVVVGGFFYACFDEATQLLVGRSGKFYDVVIDSFAVILVLLLLKGLRRTRAARPTPT